MTTSSTRDSRRRGLLVVYLKGVAMGIADAVPGVSGGTIALITGIYDRLIEAIAGVSEAKRLRQLLKSISNGRFPESILLLRLMDVPFLVVLLLGILSGVTLLANLIDLALETYRALTYAVFFGIILASPLVLRHEVALRKPRPMLAGILGVLFAFWVAGLPAHEATYSMLALFLIGAVAITAMVLPGISGSLLLVVFGAYDTMTGAVGELTRAAIATDTTAAIPPLLTITVFASGALVGVLTFARVVSKALDLDRVTTMTFLVGVMLGALRAPAREIAASVERFTPGVAVGLLVAAVVGAVLVLALEYSTGGID